MAGCQQLFNILSDWLALFLHAGDRGLDAGGIPQLEGTEFPVEAEPHGAVDFNDGVGDFGDAIGGVSPQIGERRPEELSRFAVLLRAGTLQADEQAKSRAGVFEVFRHVERGEFRFLAGMIFERLPIQG